MKMLRALTIIMIAFTPFTKSFSFLLLDPSYHLANPANVNLYIASGGCQANGITNGELSGYLDEVITNYWNTVTDSTLFITLGGEVETLVTDNPPAGQIIVGCASLSSSSIGGVANINTEKNGCRVRLNSDVYSSSSGFSKESIMAVLIHEVGHCVGLHHSDDITSVMTYNRRSWTQNQALASDDRDAVAYLYPNEKVAEVLGGCSSIASDRLNSVDQTSENYIFILSWVGGFFLIILFRFFLRQSGLFFRRNLRGLFRKY